MLYWKKDIIEELKKAGESTYSLKKSGLIGQKTFYEIKAGKVAGIKVIDSLCKRLRCQPGSLIGWKPDPEEPEAEAATDQEPETDPGESI